MSSIKSLMKIDEWVSIKNDISKIQNWVEELQSQVDPITPNFLKNIQIFAGNSFKFRDKKAI